MSLQELKKEFLKLDLSKYNNTHISNGTIIYAKKFVETSIFFLESNTGNANYKPYYDRLLEFYNKIKTK